MYGSKQVWPLTLITKKHQKHILRLMYIDNIGLQSKVHLSNCGPYGYPTDQQTAQPNENNMSD